MNSNPNNPYSAGTSFDQPLSGSPVGMSPELADTLKKFKQQVLALGVLWIILGVLVGIGAALIATGGAMLQMGGPGAQPELPPGATTSVLVLAGVSAAMSLAWIVTGIFSIMKHVWAIYSGLVLTGLALIWNLVSFSLCPVLILVVALLQGIRVAMYVGQLNRAGVPLNS